MRRLETKKSPLDKKQELFNSINKELQEVKNKLKNKEDSISKKDVEDFAESYFSDFENTVDKLQERWMTAEEEAIVKGFLHGIVLKAKANPNKYLEVKEKTEKGGLKYKFKKDEVLKLFNEMPWNQREVFVKYDLL